MLLTVTTTHQPATDLGFLLAKNPSRTHSVSLAHGDAHVFYPVATHEQCTAALLLEIDPIGLVRSGRNSANDDGPLWQYVSDRPYVASSFLSVAMARVFSSAMRGDCKHDQTLADEVWPFVAVLPVVPCRGGFALLERLFAPLGYAVDAEAVPLDPAFPAWGESPYYRLQLSATCRLQDLLTHLYVLLPVLDDNKHYWIGEAEAEKLLSRGEGWLAAHPAREEITSRYLRRQRHLVRDTLARLTPDDSEDADAHLEESEQESQLFERPLRLNEQRIATVVETLRNSGAKRILDLGCGPGQLLVALGRDPQFTQLTGMDVSARVLETAETRLERARLSETQRARITLFQGALTYRDARLAGYDAACAIEVIEHLDADRLPMFTRVVFGEARPSVVLITTPNAAYNVRYQTLAAGTFRHRDHRFEWTQAEFAAWAAIVCEQYGYTVRFVPVGEVDPDVGPPTQMGVFSR